MFSIYFCLFVEDNRKKK